MTSFLHLNPHRWQLHIWRPRIDKLMKSFKKYCAQTWYRHVSVIAYGWQRRICRTGARGWAKRLWPELKKSRISNRGVCASDMMTRTFLALCWAANLHYSTVTKGRGTSNLSEYTTLQSPKQLWSALLSKNVQSRLSMQMTVIQTAITPKEWFYRTWRRTEKTT